MNAEMLFEPVSSDEDVDFGSEFEPISDDNLSVISDFECCMLDEDLGDVEWGRTANTSVQEETVARKQPVIPLISTAEPTSQVSSEPERIKSDVIPSETRPETTPVPGGSQDCEPTPSLEPAWLPEVPLVPYEVKSCLGEFGDKVDGRNFDIMSLYTWGTKAQLQKAVEAHMIFAKRLKEQNSVEGASLRNFP